MALPASPRQHTTLRRPPPAARRQDGVHYHFTTREAFEAEIAEDKFLEFARVHSNIYGTSVRAVRDVAAAGKCCVLDIDVQGARQVRAAGLPAVFVFIAPPSLAELERRLRGRNTESEEQVTTRLRTAREEMDRCVGGCCSLKRPCALPACAAASIILPHQY